VVIWQPNFMIHRQPKIQTDTKLPWQSAWNQATTSKKLLINTISQTKQIHTNDTANIQMPQQQHVTNASRSKLKPRWSSVQHWSILQKQCLLSTAGRFRKDPIQLYILSIRFTGALLICYVAHSHSFNMAFTNCESVKFTILRFIYIFNWN